MCRLVTNGSISSFGLQGDIRAACQCSSPSSGTQKSIRPPGKVCSPQSYPTALDSKVAWSTRDSQISRLKPNVPASSDLKLHSTREEPVLNSKNNVISKYYHIQLYHLLYSIQYSLPLHLARLSH
jgi:hypothetical protein